ncbi:MAG: hydroxymethylglutaryl-CoA synthase family protein [Chitinophagales bacterium]
MQINPIVSIQAGIDDMALYVPSLYFDIEALAAQRNLVYAKLNKGLGLAKMAILDAHEDAATMAANAIAEIIDKNKLNPNEIGRIYIGTESALDGAKPTATYALQMLTARYAEQYGENCFLNCDVVDLIFACIGGVDALQNTLDWVRGASDRMGIVVSTDNAKYELNSGGEYTQGAGAVALLVKQNPRLAVIEDNWGVATQGVFDFFKPRRNTTKQQIINDVLDLTDQTDYQAPMERLKQMNGDANGIFAIKEEEITIFKETPIFDGQYSNQCYQQRIQQAFDNFRQKATAKRTYDAAAVVTDSWERIIFHLPYAFHGKRVFANVYVAELKCKGAWEAFKTQWQLEEPQADLFEDLAAYQKALGKFYRAVSKTEDYRAFVQQKIEKGQRASSDVGNMYTGAIFLSLMSTLEADLQEKTDLANKKLGMFAYGSGSKSKVFELTLQANWQAVVEQFKVEDKLKNRKGVAYEVYENLHRCRQKYSVVSPVNEFALTQVVTEKGVTEGARYYKWVD